MKKVVQSIGFMFVVLFLLPFLAVKLISSDAGMALCLLLFFVIDPLFSVLIGVFSGFSLKKRWFLPLISAIFFLLSAWIIFEWLEPTFLLYAGIYCLLGTVSMLVTHTIKVHIDKK